MKRALWLLVAAVFVAVAAPAASADQFTYSFTGACFFGGTAGTTTSFSFTTNGPAVEGTDYTLNPGATDLFDAGTDYATCPPQVPVSDYGAIEYVYFDPSTVDFCGGSTPCTIELYIVAELGSQGPTISGTTVPGPGVYDEYFGNGVLTVTDVTAPEPGSLVLLLCGLAGLFLAMRKRVSVSLG
jgi:hypothetical protein